MTMETAQPKQAPPGLLPIRLYESYIIFLVYSLTRQYIIPQMDMYFPGLSIFELNKIVIPINRDMRTHWACLSIDLEKKVSQ